MPDVINPFFRLGSIFAPKQDQGYQVAPQQNVRGGGVSLPSIVSTQPQQGNLWASIGKALLPMLTGGKVSLPQEPRYPMDERFPDGRSPMGPPAQSPYREPGMRNAYDRFQDIAANPPERKTPWLRALGTGLYSAVRHTPDETVETVVIEPGKAATPDRIQKSVSSKGAVSYQVYPGEAAVPESRRVTTQTKKGHWDPLGFDEAQKMVNYGYDKRMEDYKTQFEGAQRAAQEERQSEASESLINKRISDAELAGRREGRMDREGQQRNEVQKAKLNLAEFIARNKGQLYKQPGGNVFVINPTNGQWQDTGIPTNTLTREDEIELMAQKRLEQIEAQGRESRLNIGANTAGQIRVKQTPGAMGSQGQKELLPTQQKQQLMNQVQRMQIEHPEWMNYVEMDDNGMVHVTPAKDPNSYWGRGPDPATRQQILQYLGLGQQAPTPAPIKPTTKTAPKQQGGDTVRVRTKTGEIGTIPRSRLEEAKKLGMVEIK